MNALAASFCTASLLGMFLFGEHMQAGPMDLAAEAAGLALPITGVSALSHSHLIDSQSEPQTGVRHRGAERRGRNRAVWYCAATPPPARPARRPGRGRAGRHRAVAGLNEEEIVAAHPEIPRALALPATGLDLRPAVETVADWESAAQTWAALRGKTVLTRIGIG